MSKGDRTYIESAGSNNQNALFHMTHTTSNTCIHIFLNEYYLWQYIILLPAGTTLLPPLLPHLTIWRVCSCTSTSTKKKFRVLMLYSGKHHQEQVIEVPTRKQY